VASSLLRLDAKTSQKRGASVSSLYFFSGQKLGVSLAAKLSKGLKNEVLMVKLILNHMLLADGC
jgi:hypothetical protein